MIEALPRGLQAHPVLIKPTRYAKQGGRTKTCSWPAFWYLDLSSLSSSSDGSLAGVPWGAPPVMLSFSSALLMVSLTASMMNAG
jgi:hypothetical protein